jgi:hypothetical protein
MEVEFSTSFDGHVEASFEMATTILTANNFRLVDKTGDTLEFSGGGMSSSRQNPLVGATRIRFLHRPGQLTLEADLGGVTRMSWFLHLFPAVMGVFFLILFGVLFRQMGWWFVVAVSLGPLLPWVVLSPVLSRWIRWRAIKALENVLANLAMAGQAGP